MYKSLQKNYQFGIVYKKGKSYANKNLVMYVLPTKKEDNFFGLSVSKKVGKAVTRNRVRRLIRECLRLQCSKYKKGHDIVIIARADAAGKSFAEIKSSINNLIKRHDIALKARQ